MIVVRSRNIHRAEESRDYQYQENGYLAYLDYAILLCNIDLSILITESILFTLI